MAAELTQKKIFTDLKKKNITIYIFYDIQRPNKREREREKEWEHVSKKGDGRKKTTAAQRHVT